MPKHSDSLSLGARHGRLNFLRSSLLPPISLLLHKRSFAQPWHVYYPHGESESFTKGPVLSNTMKNGISTLEILTIPGQGQFTPVLYQIIFGLWREMKFVLRQWPSSDFLEAFLHLRNALAHWGTDQNTCPKCSTHIKQWLQYSNETETVRNITYRICILEQIQINSSLGYQGPGEGWENAKNGTSTTLWSTTLCKFLWTCLIASCFNPLTDMCHVLVIDGCEPVLPRETA